MRHKKREIPHPETPKGFVWVANMPKDSSQWREFSDGLDEVRSALPPYRSPTQFVGNVAYDAFGDSLSDAWPVFERRDVLAARGIEIRPSMESVLLGFRYSILLEASRRLLASEPPFPAVAKLTWKPNHKAKVDWLTKHGHFSQVIRAAIHGAPPDDSESLLAAWKSEALRVSAEIRIAERNRSVASTTPFMSHSAESRGDAEAVLLSLGRARRGADGKVRLRDVDLASKSLAQCCVGFLANGDATIISRLTEAFGGFSLRPHYDGQSKAAFVDISALEACGIEVLPGLDKSAFMLMSDLGLSLSDIDNTVRSVFLDTELRELTASCLNSAERREQIDRLMAGHLEWRAMTFAIECADSLEDGERLYEAWADKMRDLAAENDVLPRM